MNKKYFFFALLLVSSAFFFGCTSGTSGSYDGKFCFAQMFKDGKQVNYLCEPISESITEQFCLSNSPFGDGMTMMNGKIVYSDCKKRVFCYWNNHCYELDEYVTMERCLSDPANAGGGLGGQVVAACPKD